MTHLGWSWRHVLPVSALAAGIACSFVGVSVAVLPPAAAILTLAVLLGLVTATVFAVVHHAEAVAHRIGEPYGTLLLTLAVTTIEASIILSLMMHGANNPTLARESVFSTVMIVTTGVVGICLFLGGWRHYKQEIQRQGTNALLAVLMALSVLTLILPDFTLTTGPGSFSTLQLAFVSTLSLLLYAAFLFAQTVRHQEDFVEDMISVRTHAHVVPDRAATIASGLLLVLGLVGIVLLAEQIAAGIEDELIVVGITESDAIIGAFIALLVLMPESVAAVRAALTNELQRSINIALGSACATIGLTIPVVAAASLISGRSLTLGLSAGDTVLLLLALAISIVSFGTGRTTVLTGLVHLVLFVAYLLLVAVP